MGAGGLGYILRGEVIIHPLTPLSASFSPDHSLIPTQHYTQAREKPRSHEWSILESVRKDETVKESIHKEERTLILLIPSP